MGQEPADAALSTEPWPPALTGLRHSDQLRVILAGMPRAAGREVDWAERVEHVRSHQPADVIERPALPAPDVTPAAEIHEPAAEADPNAAVVPEPGVPVTPFEMGPPAAPYESVPVPHAVAFESVPVAPREQVVQPVTALPLPPQPILWVPSSAFDGAPPPAPAAPVQSVPIQIQVVAPPPVTASVFDPRFVPIAATGHSRYGSPTPTTGWTMRLGFGDPQPVPNSIAAAQSLSVSTRRRRWRRVVTIVVVVVVLAAAAAAGWLVYRHRMAQHHAAAVAAATVVPQDAIGPGPGV